MVIGVIMETLEKTLIIGIVGVVLDQEVTEIREAASVVAVTGRSVDPSMKTCQIHQLVSSCIYLNNHVSK